MIKIKVPESKKLSLEPKRRKKKSPDGGSVDSKSKKGKFILFLGDEGAILVFIQAGKVVRRLYAPSVEEEHLATLLELMHSHSACPVYILVDMIDQSYVRHTLPPVSPLGVNKLVQRRLDRDFVPEDIKGSLSLGREKTGRKEWNFLLIALANTATLQQWTDVLLELPNRFMGIYLVPVESQKFVAQLSANMTMPGDRDVKWQVLVTHDKVSGFRQVVLKEGRLIFTRLTQGHGDSPEVLAGNVEQEILNTIEYLRRLSYNEQAGLEIFIIVSQDIKEKIDAHKLKAERTHILSPFEVSQDLNLGQAALSGDRFGDVVISTAFGLQKKHTLRLMPLYGKKLDQFYKIRTAARATAALLIAAITLNAGSQLVDMQSFSSETNKMENELKTTQQELEKIEQAITALGEDQNTILNAAAVYRASQAGLYKPLDFIREFAPTLGNGVLVRSIYWQAGSVTGGAKAKPGRGAQPPAAAPAAGAVTGEFNPFTVSLEVEFNQHGGQRQKLVEDSEAFIERLKGSFLQFTVEAEKIRGAKAQEDKLVVNFDDPKLSNTELKEGEDVLRLTMTGPLPPELLEKKTEQP